MIRQRDYVTALVVNRDREALIVEQEHPQTGALVWQVIGCQISEADDPTTLIQQELKRQAGCESAAWVYLGSYRSRMGPTRHFYFAHDATPPPIPATINGRHGPAPIRWVSLTQLRYALLDGRVANISDVANIALAMYLMLPEHSTSTAS